MFNVNNVKKIQPMLLKTKVKYLREEKKMQNWNNIDIFFFVSFFTSRKTLF